MSRSAAAVEPPLASAPKRTVQVNYRKGKRCATVVRIVQFEKGFGHYINWRRRRMLVDPLDTVLTV